MWHHLDGVRHEPFSSNIPINIIRVLEAIVMCIGMYEICHATWGHLNRLRKKTLSHQ
jgi:hypothetical protein